MDPVQILEELLRELEGLENRHSPQPPIGTCLIGSYSPIGLCTDLAEYPEAFVVMGDGGRFPKVKVHRTDIMALIKVVEPVMSD